MMSMTESTSLKYIYTCHISKIKKNNTSTSCKNQAPKKKKGPKDFDNTITYSRIHANDSYSIYALTMY